MTLSERSQHIATEIREDGVAIISYNRQEVANPINTDTMKELLDAYTRLLTDDNVKVLIQTGKVGFFSAGMDLSGQQQSSANTKGQALLHSMNKLMIDCDQILIAAVNGPGAGYGTSSLGLFDLVYSVPDAYFFTPFVKWGLAAEASSSFAFAHALGRQKASHLILTGERMTAQELESAGLISKIFPADGFLDAVLGIAHRVAELPPIALTANKSLLTSYSKEQLHRATDLELELFARLAAGSETKEAVQRFAIEQKAKTLSLAIRGNL
ncbi:dodecenoyl delta-isomerase [Fusarium coicis]|nr:dodecenoyl delta-isomerase [Fusarium coicis]